MDFDLVSNLLLGFENAVSLQNLLYCLIGVSVGTLIGVLPGMGPVATVAMLLPITYALHPAAALIMLAGIYYGAEYGGSTTAVLVNIPGEAAAVVTCIDGHQMAKRGRAGSALGIAAIGSFVAGCFATLLIAAFAPPLTAIAFKFGPAEYFSLMVLGLVGAVVLASGSILKAVCMIFVGLLLGLVGSDVNSGALRFTFGIDELMDGISFVALSMGIYGFAEIMKNLEATIGRTLVPAEVKSVLPSREELKASAGPIARGTLIGSFLGILPGGGALLSSFASYTVEKKLAGAKADPPFGRATSAASRAPRRPTTRARRRASSRCSRSAFPRTR
ncbi:MAG: Tripartite tricarboxylate transporter permease [Burkholderia sp.]|jgi:putative tricarboxylic transport membrane protein